MNAIIPFIPLVIITGLFLALLISYLRYQRFSKNRQFDIAGDELPETLILKRPFAQYSAKYLKKLQLILVSTFLIVVALFFGAWLLNQDLVNTGSADTYIVNMLKQIGDDSQLLFVLVSLFVFTILYPVYLGRSKKNEMLVLTKESISYQPAGLFLSDLFLPAWTLKWKDIATASLYRSGVQSKVCMADDKGKKKCLLINQWREKITNGESRPAFLSEIWEANELAKNPDAILDRPLVRYIRKYTDINLGISKSDMHFDLLSSPRIKATLIVMFVLGSYALIDSLLNMETYLVTPPLWWFVVGGFIAVIFVFMKIFDATTPLSNAVGVAVIFGVVFGVALYPGLLRINQVTDPYGMRTYDYHMEHDGVFRSNDTMLPVIKMPSDKYWRSIDTGQSYTFKLRKGGLGFYQIDMDDVYAKTRKWYCQQEKKHPGNIRVGCD